MEKKYTIAVAGTGYVGLSNAILLAQHHKVLAVDIIPEKVELINQRKSPIIDAEIQQYLAEKDLDLTATLDGAAAYRQADFVIIAAPTNYDSRKNFFDTSAVEAVIDWCCPAIRMQSWSSSLPFRWAIPSPSGKSTTVRTSCSAGISPGGRALYDNLYPSRIIVGTDAADETLTAAAHTFAGLLREGAIKEEIPTLFMGYTEAEAVKLFANTYLALRVSYFNELDTYAEMKGWIPGRSSTAFAWIPVSAHTITIRPLATALLPAQGYETAPGELC